MPHYAPAVTFLLVVAFYVVMFWNGSPFRYVWAWLRGGQPVTLGYKPYGKVYKTIAFMKVDEWTGEKVLKAPVYWTGNVGEVVLLEDGKIHPDSYSCYIRSWVKG